MSVKRYQLKPNTVLDGRYLIRQVLGEGGFGITYEGVNQRIGMRVAIKEFFCRDYMDRDNEKSEGIFLSEPSMEKRFRSEKERFLKEARILGDFSGEKGVVHIIDYFEINNTAYIVMPFLDGKTLRQVVAKNGPMEPERLFRSFKPLFQTLGKIHETGLIHRDISPDNIMLLADGTLCLIDFGAAYRYDHQTKSYTIISKHGYAAPEQYKADGKIGPAADIYALSATLYFCLTGADPEDSLQRILLDDLKMPAELGISMPKPAEELITRGLELKEANRWPDVKELIEKIDLAYPDRTEKEKNKKKYIMAGIIAAAAAFCVIIALSWYSAHKTELRFKNIETQTVWLTPNEEMTVTEYNQSSETVKERLEVFSGKDNYLWKEEEGQIRIEIPAECLCDKDPKYVFEAYIARPMEMSLLPEESNGKDAVPLFYDASFDSIRIREGEFDRIDRDEFNLPETGDYKYLELCLNEQTAAAVNEKYDGILNTENMLALAYDRDQKYETSYWETCLSLGDGRTLALINWDQDGTFFDVLQYDLTHEAAKKDFSVTAEWIVQTEEELKNIATGKNQVDDGTLTGEVMLLRFSNNIDFETQKASWFHNLIAFKDRLDVLEIPYEFYLMENEQLQDKNTFVVAVKKDALSRFVITMLTEKYLSYSMGSDWGGFKDVGYDLFFRFLRLLATDQEISMYMQYYGLSKDDLDSGKLVVFKEDGIHYRLSDNLLTLNGEELEYMAEDLRKAGLDRVVCYANDFAVAGCTLNDFEQGIKDGEIVFSDLYFAGDRKEYETVSRLFSFMINQELASALTLNDIQVENRQTRDKPEEYKEEDLRKALNPLYQEQPELYASLETFASEHGGEFEKEFDEQFGVKLILRFYDIPKEDLPSAMTDLTEELLAAYEDDLNSRDIHRMELHFALNGKDADQPDQVRMIFDRSPEQFMLAVDATLEYIGMSEGENAAEYRKKLLDAVNGSLEDSILKSRFKIDSDTGAPFEMFRLKHG